jgi:hypothetical protein
LTSRKEAANQETPQKDNAWRKALPLLRGLALAIPVWLVLASLLSSADPIFGRGLADILAIFRLEKLPEYLVRFTYILVLGYLLAGVYLHALEARGEPTLLGLDKPLMPAFLCFIEAATILGGVILLFGAFVGVQFRYFFGGQANIHLAGYTYAEYARRGFAELLAVALLSLLLFLGLSWITKRDSASQKRLFSTLGILLTLLVTVILVSAFQRLLLYEQAYGLPGCAPTISTICHFAVSLILLD